MGQSQEVWQCVLIFADPATTLNLPASGVDWGTGAWEGEQSIHGLEGKNKFSRKYSLDLVLSVFLSVLQDQDWRELVWK